MEPYVKSTHNDYGSENGHEKVKFQKNNPMDLINMKSVSEASTDSGFSDQSRRSNEDLADQENEDEPGQMLSEAMRHGEFKKFSKRKSQWRQYLMNVDMRRVLASGTFKLTLMQLARDGESDTLDFLLSSLNSAQTRRMLNSATDEEGATPLHIAAKNNHYDVCKKLVTAGASVSIRAGESRATPLHFAARIRPKKRTLVSIAEEQSDCLDTNVIQRDTMFDRERSIILLLHSSGANVNDADIEGQSALHCATIKGNTSCVLQLLECEGINVDMKDSLGMTALHLAATHGYHAIVNALIQKGASLRATDNDLMTPLHFACADGNVAVVRRIINQARQSNPGRVKEMTMTPDAGKNTALHIAVGKGHAAVVNELLSLLPSTEDIKNLVTMPRSHGDTPMHIAAAQGFLDICVRLITCGADVDARNDSLATPLLHAAHHNNFEVIEFLHERGSDLETRDKDNLTPLLLACKQGHIETLSWLIEHDADTTATDKHDKTCLMLAVEDQRTAAVHELLKYESILRLMDETDKNTNSVLHIASAKGYLPIVRVLLDHGARIDSKNEDEATALHIAAKHGQNIILKELLNHSKTTINGIDENANTPLHLAAIEGHAKCVETLIQHGANVALRNTRQMTPLDCACSKGWETTVVALLKAQAAVNPIKGSKTTPLHEACANGHPQVVNILLDWRADVTAKLSDGRNPLDCAIDQDEPECVQAILSHVSWRDAMRNAYVDPITEEVVTPSRKLIVKMPEKAEYAFTRSISDNKKKWDQKDLEVTLDFEFLDDMYTVTQWLHKGKELIYENIRSREVEEQHDKLGVDFQGHQAMTTPLTLRGNLSIPEDPGSYEAYNDHGKLNSNAITYTEDANVLRHNHPLMIMVSKKREALLQHPVVTALLQYKWDKYGGFVYYSSLVILMLFVILLNCYMLLIPPPYTIDFLKSLANRRFYKDFTDEHLTNYSEPRSCYSSLEEGITYRGFVNISRTNRTCIKWSTTNTDSVLYPESGLENNYCRNPGARFDKPWCFTNYSDDNPEFIVREECDVPMCPVYGQSRWWPRARPCTIPFVFMNTTHEKCISASDGKWCSITANYDKDRRWGYCTEVDPDCIVPVWKRRVCGKPGIDKLNCEARGCCYEIHDEGTPNEYSECFQRVDECSDFNPYCEIHVDYTGCDHKWMKATCPLACGHCNVTEEIEDTEMKRFLYLMSTYPEETFDHQWQIGCYYCLPGAEKKWGTHCRYRGDWEAPVKIILFVLCIFNLIRLILQIWNYRLEALKPIFFVEVTLYILCMLLVINTSGFDLEHTNEMANERELYGPIIDVFQEETGIRQNWQWQCGVMALFLSWMNLLLYIQKIPYLGIYVVMFNDIFKTFSKFSFVFLLFILSFAFTFHVLLQNEIEFEFPFQSILKATVMMVGEMDFTGIFLGGSEEYAEKVNYLILTYILFAIFIIFMMIIIMNLLVGLAVGDIMEVQQHATLERLKMQVELALEVEFSVPNLIRKRFVRKSATIKPNKHRGRNALTRAIFEDKNLSTKNIARVVASQKSENEAVQETVQQVVTIVRDMRSKILDLELAMKDILTETREMKCAVDDTADVQEQKISLEDESKLPTSAMSKQKENKCVPSPVPLRSVIPAFMRSSSFRRGSIGSRLRGSMKRNHYSSMDVFQKLNPDGAPLMSDTDDPIVHIYENQNLVQAPRKLVLPEFDHNDDEFEA